MRPEIQVSTLQISNPNLARMITPPASPGTTPSTPPRPTAPNGLLTPPDTPENSYQEASTLRQRFVVNPPEPQYKTLPPTPSIVQSEPGPTKNTRSVGVQTGNEEPVKIIYASAPAPQPIVIELRHTINYAPTPPPPAQQAPWFQPTPPENDAGKWAWAKYRAKQGLFMMAWALVSILAVVNVPLIVNLRGSSRA